MKAASSLPLSGALCENTRNVGTEGDFELRTEWAALAVVLVTARVLAPECGGTALPLYA